MGWDASSPCYFGRLHFATSQSYRHRRPPPEETPPGPEAPSPPQSTHPCTRRWRCGVLNTQICASAVCGFRARNSQHSSLASGRIAFGSCGADPSRAKNGLSAPKGRGPGLCFRLSGLNPRPASRRCEMRTQAGGKCCASLISAAKKDHARCVNRLLGLGKSHWWR
jgi:hypothetical protein